MRTKTLFAFAVLFSACAFADGEGQAAPDARVRPGRLRANPALHAARSPAHMRGMRLRGPAPRPFGTLADGRKATLWRLYGRGGLIMDFTDYGARLVRAYAPDRNGNLADVTLGFNDAADYEKHGFSMGTVVGRFANRIAGGRFSLDGKEYALALNNENGGVKCNLHSGPDGWDTKLWSAEPFNEGPTSCISFSLVSPDGDMGFPGKVEATVTYRIRPDNVWSVEYEAKTDAPTVINLTHHSYWNLAGESSGTVLGQELQIFADEYTEVASSLIPVKNAPVAGTPFDFTTMKKIGSALSSASANEQLGFGSGWYDHNFVLRASSGAMKPACRLRDPVSGRTLEISTTEPGMQVYGAQGMSASLPAKAPGKALCQYAGIAIETQHFPDSPNRPDFPSTVLRPGETFHSVTEYRFGVEK